jgi:hypothetical protein
MLIFLPFHVIDIFSFPLFFGWARLVSYFLCLLSAFDGFVFLRQRNVDIGETQIMCKQLNEAYNNLRLHTRVHMLSIPNTLGGVKQIIEDCLFQFEHGSVEGEIIVFFVGIHSPLR